MELRQRACAEQFVRLLEFMERHGDLARPQYSAQGRLRAEQLWEELTGLLNSVAGGTQKPSEKWRKAWADWKTKTKKKASIKQRDASGTGGGPSKRPRVTTLEGRVLNILGFSTVTGDEEAQMQPQQDSQSSPPSALPVTKTCREFAISTPPAPPSGTSSRIQEGVRVMSTARESPPPSAAPSEQSTRRIRSRPVRRWRALTPYDRTTNQFVAVEQARLRMEEERDRRLHEREVERERMLHEREMERLRVDAQRVGVERERNILLKRLADIPLLLTQLLEQSKQ